MEFLECSYTVLPQDLLLEADPDWQSISSYLDGSWCFIAQDNSQILAACVVKATSPSVAEIFNIAVYPQWQQQGIGSQLLKFVLAQLSLKAITRVELGTGTFGYQLTYYQRLGFRVDGVIKNHFVDHYPEPIYEHGIQHQDMLRLSISLESEQ